MSEPRDLSQSVLVPTLPCLLPTTVVVVSR